MSKICPKFKGKIVGSRFFPFDPEMYEAWLLQFDGKIVEVLVQEYKKKRSDQQNKYLWACVYKIIGEELGYTPDETHALMGTMFLKDYKEFKGKRYTVVRSTTSLNTAEFSEYIEKIKDVASMELNLIIPEAEDIQL